jgi:hypothetical protein
MTQPRQCATSVLCRTQPALAVVNRLSKQVNYTFTGSVYAQLDSRPTTGSSLFVEESCGSSTCVTAVVGSYATVALVDGIATFQVLETVRVSFFGGFTDLLFYQNLLFKTSGSYTLKFILVDFMGHPVAMTVSDVFSVSTGSIYGLSLFNFIGTAFGGESFSSNPVVAVVDKGGNVLTAINNATVVATLTSSPTGFERLRSSTGMLWAPVVGGFARFFGLFINESGMGYRITFSSTVRASIILQMLRHFPLNGSFCCVCVNVCVNRESVASSPMRFLLLSARRINCRWPRIPFQVGALNILGNAFKFHPVLSCSIWVVTESCRTTPVLSRCQ